MKKKTPISDKDWKAHIEKAVSLIERGKSFFFAADLDADSVGSMLSTALYLQLSGKQVYVVLAEGLGDNLDFLQQIIDYNSIRIVLSEEEIVDIKDNIDTVIFFDTANAKLVPFYYAIRENILHKRPSVIEIDHHFGADSEEITDYGIKLYRQANANTEIIAELLIQLKKKNPDSPDPFGQRNILISLITGLLWDTLGGKVIPYKEDYDYWINKLETRLKNITRWRESRDGTLADDPHTKFGYSDGILNYMNQLDQEKQQCLNVCTDRIFVDEGVASLNLLHFTYPDVQAFCKSYDSEWFAPIRDFLLNIVPEKSGKIGIVYFEGQNADGDDCIFIKARRAVDYAGYDLRQVEGEVRKAFSKENYMGGGGHPGAVSFRVQPMNCDEFKAGLAKTIDSIKKNLP